jgi:hypothetical protein
MEVKLKNIEVINAMNSTKILLQTEDKDFSVKARWNLMKNMKKYESIFKTYSESEIEYVSRYAMKDVDGKFISEEGTNEPKFTPSNKNEYLSKRDELLECENTIDILKVKLSDLEGHVKNGEILYHLEFMIDDSEEIDK